MEDRWKKKNRVLRNKTTSSLKSKCIQKRGGEKKKRNGANGLNGREKKERKKEARALAYYTWGKEKRKGKKRKIKGKGWDECVMQVSTIV